MLADFYIPSLSNDMKIPVQKNNLGGQIGYRSLDPVKKTASFRHFLSYIGETLHKYNSMFRISSYRQQREIRYVKYFQRVSEIDPLRYSLQNGVPKKRFRKF